MANPEMCRQFVETNGAKLPPKKKRERSAPTRSRRPRAISPARREELEAWAFIKRCMIEAQLKTNGYTSCMECGAINPPRLDLDHDIPAGNGGAWEPENGVLRCGGPGSCHARKHGEPMWSREVAV